MLIVLPGRREAVLVGQVCPGWGPWTGLSVCYCNPINNYTEKKKCERNSYSPSRELFWKSNFLFQSQQKKMTSCVKVLVAQSCPTLCDPMDCILQARTLEWVAISFSRGVSWLRDQNQVSYIGSETFVCLLTDTPQDLGAVFGTWEALKIYLLSEWQPPINLGSFSGSLLIGKIIFDIISYLLSAKSCSKCV